MNFCRLRVIIDFSRQLQNVVNELLCVVCLPLCHMFKFKTLHEISWKFYC